MTSSHEPIPTDQVARQLMLMGARREALALLRAAVIRDEGENACRVLLRAVLARPRSSFSSPGGVPLDMTTAERWIRRGMLLEALSLLRGSSLGKTQSGATWIGLLGELLAPVPPCSEVVLREVMHQLYRGGATIALTLLEERAALATPLPPWALRKLSLLRWLLLENAKPAREPPVVVSGSTDLAQALREQIERRSMQGALQAAIAYRQRNPDDPEAMRVVAALDRLISAVMGERGAGQEDTETVEVSGHSAANMHLMMGNLEAAERLFRKLTTENPADRLAQTLLEDVGALRAALRREGRSAAAVPVEEPALAELPSQDPLPEEPTEVSRVVASQEPEGDKLSPAAASALAGAFDQEVTFDASMTVDEQWDDMSTSSGRHEPEEAAALAYVQGRYEDALRMYAALAAKSPGEPRFRERLAEIVERIDRDAAADSEDVTIQRPIPAELRRRAVNTDMRLSAAARHAIRLAEGLDSSAVVIRRIVRVGPTRAGG